MHDKETLLNQGLDGAGLGQELPVTTTNGPISTTKFETGRNVNKINLRYGDPSAPIEFREHPMDNPKVAIDCHPEKGLGVYANEFIKQGELVASFDPRYGCVFQAQTIQDLGWTWIIDRVVQIGENRFLAHHGLGEHLNHSCDPNCGLIDGYKVQGLVEDAVGIITMRDIQPGEELCWDYGMSENSNWKMTGCLCGSPNCRGTVTANRDLPPEVREKYKPYTLEWIKNQTITGGCKIDSLEKNYRIDNYLSPIDDEVVSEVADFFREIFSNDWKNYAACVDCEVGQPGGMRVSAREVYANKDKSIPLEVIDFAKILPDCPCCKGKMIRFIDAEKTLAKFRNKFKENAVLTVLRDESDKVSGMIFGNVCTLKEAFESEEWKHPHAYAAMQDPRLFRDFNKFYSELRHQIEISGYSGPTIETDFPIFLSNCAAIDPVARGKGYLPQLMREHINAIPKSYTDNLGIIGEVERNSKFHLILKKVGLIDAGDLLGQNHLILFGSLSDFVNGVKDY